MRKKCFLIGMLITAAMLFGLFCLLRPGDVARAAGPCVPGPHKGTIASDQSWCREGGSVHQLSGDVTVAAGVTLTIEPGVQVESAYSNDLIVQGALLSLGTATQPITFTIAAGESSWPGINFNGGSGRMTFTTIQEARASLNIQNSPAGGWVEVEDCRILADPSDINVSYGIQLNQGHLTLRRSRVSGVHHTGNTWNAHPINVTGASSELLLEGNTFSDNTQPYIFLSNNALTEGDIDLVKQDGLEGWEIQSNYTVPQGRTLTLRPGVKLYIRHETSGTLTVLVKGRLQALGTADQPIRVVASTYDYLTLKLDGADGDGTAALRYVTFDHDGLNPQLQIVNVQSEVVSLEDCVFQNGSHSGLYISNSRVDLQRTRFSNFANTNGSRYPLEIEGPGSQVSMSGNNFENNHKNRIRLTNSAMAGANFGLPAQPGLLSYDFLDDYSLPAGVTLTVAPGVTLRGSSSSALFVRGYLQAVGQPDAPIGFTSVGTGPSYNEYWDGLVFLEGGSGHLQYTDLSRGYMGSDSPAVEGDGVINVARNPATEVLVENSRIHDCWTVGASVSNGRLRIVNSSIDHNYTGVQAGPFGEANLIHTTITNQISAGVSAVRWSGFDCIPNCGRANVVNSILAFNQVPVNSDEYSFISVDHALYNKHSYFDTTNVSETAVISATAGLEADFIHLTASSAAINRGKDAGIGIDFDGDLRPLGLPDLGADEFGSSSGQQAAFEKIALQTIWMSEKLANGQQAGYVVQEYILRYLHPTAETTALTISDNLPALLTLKGQSPSPAMGFQQNGHLLTWQALGPLPAGQSAVVRLSTQGAGLQPGDSLTNSAQAVATSAQGVTQLNDQVTTMAPLYRPLIGFPRGHGEVCSEPDGTYLVSGAAQPGQLVRVYEDGVPAGEGLVQPDGSFAVHYASKLAQGEGTGVQLSAATCTPDGLTCGEQTRPLSLTHPEGFFCPQRSTWEWDWISGPEKIHYSWPFRDWQGLNYSTRNWALLHETRHNTQLRLYACNCPDSDQLPTKIWVYLPTLDKTFQADAVNGRWYIFNMGTVANPGNPVFHAECGTTVSFYTDVNLIDPDGYVYDASKGFNPDQPVQNVLPGTTVTAYAYLPEWGGWVPWPAHLYGQQNPQVVGGNGYFAFFTPPGKYYLEATPLPGFQGYRSPVLEVIDTIIHWNIPLTPLPAAAPAARLAVLPQGGSPITITVSAGQVVEWASTLPMEAGEDAYRQYSLVPGVRLWTANPTSASPLGWDSGALAPGGVYRRVFTTPGIYTYALGNGQTGSVVVKPAEKKVYLPAVIKAKQ